MRPEMAAPVRFLFDFVSPYSYLAWTQIHRIAERHGREVEPVPIVLGAVLKARSAKGPAEVPHRRAYAARDIARLAHAYGVPLVPPPVHPFNPLLALRVATLPAPPAARRALIDAIFASTWVTGEGSTERAVVARAADAAGLGGDEALAAAETDENKLRLRRQTDEALAAGVFGVPTMFVDGEMFFGNDSLPHLERFLRGELPALSASLVEWGSKL
jgi:2-hydroxychromene-2-carboxylate isomerase